MRKRDTLEQELEFRKHSIYDKYDADKELQTLSKTVELLVKYLKKVFLNLPNTKEVCPQCNNQSVEAVAKQCNNQECKFSTKRRISYREYSKWMEDD